MARKENALDLAKFIDKGVRVKLSGGREGALPRQTNMTRSPREPSSCANMVPCDAVEGVLKGYDQLLNLVLDETVEYARGAPCMHASLSYSSVLRQWQPADADAPCLLLQIATTC